MPVVYGDRLSGNCYKIALLFAQLNIEHTWQEVLVTRGDTRSESFVAMNPARQIPVVVLDDGTTLTQSNAILHHFAADTALVPALALDKTHVLEWQFFEQYSHEPYIAVRRYIKRFLQLPDDRLAEFNAKEAGSYHALQVMEQHLSDHEFLVGRHYSLADISLYAYTHVAHEADLDLSGYPSVQRWLRTVASQPGHQPMEAASHA